MTEETYNQGRQDAEDGKPSNPPHGGGIEGILDILPIAGSNQQDNEDYERGYDEVKNR